NFIGTDYEYAASGKHSATARYEFTPPKTGNYDLRISWQPHENRSPNALVIVEGAKNGKAEQRVNQQVAATLDKGFHSLGIYEFEGAIPAAVVLSNEGATGNIHADAVQVLAIKSTE
ncbi:MAG: NADH-dependent oxidoreductase, partial [Verrucomicrobiales bacterium]|nr:NADH-dependent oxidoreductase [Verrucomicrobiales bacterium]